MIVEVAIRKEYAVQHHKVMAREELVSKVMASPESKVPNVLGMTENVSL